ncbi:MAG: T9SS type A sorting domain-containing protein [Saprospiraceae bacterium]|nr:T9SS type A sorting domain-containing protein [Saprospiraceae bacterium]
MNNILFKENTVIHIYDSVGRQVMNTTINEKQINVASLSSGIYIFDITNGKSIVGKGSFVKM